MTEQHICATPEDTFALGEKLGKNLCTGDAVLLIGGLGAGKTLFAKGVLRAFGYDTDEVTSPSFTLVNLYRAPKFDVYHIDLWRIDDGGDAAFAVGLDEILDSENTVVIIEWAEKLGNYPFPSRVFKVNIDGDGDEHRRITVECPS